MGFVLYYLVRVEPFASYHTALQVGVRVRVRA